MIDWKIFLERIVLIYEEFFQINQKKNPIENCAKEKKPAIKKMKNCQNIYKRT